MIGRMKMGHWRIEFFCRNEWRPAMQPYHQTLASALEDYAKRRNDANGHCTGRYRVTHWRGGDGAHWEVVLYEKPYPKWGTI